ncbi:MAG TPA: GH116 family glycosyl hydrolase [Phycisphaerae bacterium]|jgi:uncharacterized protein (DUF608 family)|nr:GH116 family glycosyl hydrolase [Phycisphaerae bacterium]HPP19532.1 GH116 family glycosyl hydrolase [Phycisphaerae bacterium]HPU32646.1 GH116 family glycosyl hydrolase [Phycisphaerae bacterium]HXK86729.1 GH116 family glycosyl hydrolase [Phycisphaerae bacterium]
MAAHEHDASSMHRRDFLKKSVATAGVIGAAAGAAPGAPGAPQNSETRPPGLETHSQAPRPAASLREYNGPYTGKYLNRVAFPMGGIGAGMICLEGTGALSHVSLRNRPEIFNEPQTFTAVCVKGRPNVARVLEGPVPSWKAFGLEGTGNGAPGKTYGLPRFREASFRARFPFGTIRLADRKVPLLVEITGWSPFTPPDPDGASLPVAALEYRFVNTSAASMEAVFSFNTRNFLALGGRQDNGVQPMPGGLRLFQAGSKEKPHEEAAFCAFVTDPAVKVNAAWFRGGWWDSLTMAWKDVQEGACYDRPPVSEGGPAPGGSLFVPFQLEPGQEKTVTLLLAWFSGQTNQRIGKDPQPDPSPSTYKPWYAGRFKNLEEVAGYWRENYAQLREKTKAFSDCFYDSTLPPEVLEAVAANLTILKSPTVLRQADGRLWAWEGCSDNSGCCHGSCTHVWNYAQAIPHLFPALERSLRDTEFGESQEDTTGHQTFRASLPIRPVKREFHAAADGQLGGIMKVYREWRISGDTEWLRRKWKDVRQSLDYCIETWDPRRQGILEEPHHNTYDIEFWGPNGMCTSFYLGALSAAVRMGEALQDDVTGYKDLYEKGRKFMESQLWNGEYFIQKVQWVGLKAESPLKVQSFHGGYSPEALELLKKEGPKYQYGNGCLADGVLGAWIAAVCGVGEILDPAKVAGHLKSVHKYNLKKDLSEHANPQRPTYALGSEGGLLLCTWPKGGALSLPFVYSNEVWTGIEYHVASHLMMMGLVDEGLEIVRTARDRYDGRVRNPFNEYECGHWYARAMSSYGLLQGLTGIRYDAVEKRLYIQPRIKGDFRSFIATATGFGTAGVKDGKPFLEVKSGTIEVKKTEYVPVA